MHILVMSPPLELACSHAKSSVSQPTKECRQLYEWLLYSRDSYCSSIMPAPHSELLPRLWHHTDLTEPVLVNCVHSRVERPTRTDKYDVHGNL